MRKYCLGFILLFFISFCSGVLAPALEAAEVIGIKGKVEVQFVAEKVWKLARVGTKLAVGDSIRTARNSNADILLEPGTKNYMRIDESTLVVLNSNTPGEIDRFDLSNGKIYANIEQAKAGLTYEVHTPSAVAGVRGTAWSVDSGKEMDEAATYEANIYLKTYDANNNLISEITVPEGFKTFVERFEGPSALIELTTEEMQDWDSVREEVSSRIEEAAARREEGGGEGGGQGRGEQTEEEAMEDAAQSLEQITEDQESIADELGDVKDFLEEQRIEDNIKDIINDHGYYYH